MILLPDKTDILIVGAGIIGLTLARELIARGYEEIVIIEKEPELGLHASGRNSGVLHAGIYYAPESLKAKMCLKGNFLMRAYCKEKGLPLLEKGKVIVARNASEIPMLAELYRRATANGARVEIIDEKQLAAIEPNAKTAGKALFSHYTAQVDPKAVLKSIQKELVGSAKVKIFTNCRLTGLAGSLTAVTTRGNIAFSRCVNAAGAYCDRVARAFGLSHRYRLIPFKGIYRKLKKTAPYTVNGNIYPVPDIRNPFLGVHFTRSAHGDVYIGPTAIPAFGRENYGIFAGIDPEGLSIALSDMVLFCTNPKFRTVAVSEPIKYVSSVFFRDAGKLVKRLRPEDIEPSNKVGIRAQLVDWNTKEMVMDFLVRQDGEVVHILNPVSPAFTCSMELARQIVQTYFQK
ncbi:MAG: L-2-hydroxyglutarate oxidase [Desulfobacterales bacterium]|uniref:L-2-hydroxyglutarate oxidase n=1 Tax=Candidatus Desulfatibia profunda TaxID=2841695 RepID=A0A8J6TNP3_9BACT|nr:L-2-hydroxyglutarate oxidase [Candidatus Desulfatibia profunda]MBL7181077.1 L-2-hydroxyglutarate oxidase [Desulfobacterales bacterium]